jgi:hypothetical protein
MKAILFTRNSTGFGLVLRRSVYNAYNVALCSSVSVDMLGDMGLKKAFYSLLFVDPDISVGSEVGRTGGTVE